MALPRRHPAARRSLAWTGPPTWPVARSPVHLLAPQHKHCGIPRTAPVFARVAEHIGGTSSRSARLEDAPCRCTGYQGTVRRGSGRGSCAREPDANATHGRYQPARKGGCLPVPVWVHRERVLRRAGSAVNADMPRADADGEVGACRQSSGTAGQAGSRPTWCDSTTVTPPWCFPARTRSSSIRVGRLGRGRREASPRAMLKLYFQEFALAQQRKLSREGIAAAR